MKARLVLSALAVLLLVPAVVRAGEMKPAAGVPQILVSKADALYACVAFHQTHANSGGIGLTDRDRKVLLLDKLASDALLRKAGMPAQQIDARGQSALAAVMASYDTTDEAARSRRDADCIAMLERVYAAALPNLPEAQRTAFR
jgi:hypothetical protein